MKVKQELETIYSFEGPLDDIITFASALKAKYADKENLRVISTSRQFENGENLVLFCDREENEAEKKKREESEAQTKRYRQQQYESLKKEFEGVKQ